MGKKAVRAASLRAGLNRTLLYQRTEEGNLAFVFLRSARRLQNEGQTARPLILQNPSKAVPADITLAQISVTVFSAAAGKFAVVNMHGFQSGETDDRKEE